MIPKPAEAPAWWVTYEEAFRVCNSMTDDNSKCYEPNSKLCWLQNYHLLVRNKEVRFVWICRLLFALKRVRIKKSIFYIEYDPFAWTKELTLTDRSPYLRGVHSKEVSVTDRCPWGEVWLNFFSLYFSVKENLSSLILAHKTIIVDSIAWNVTACKQAVLNIACVLGEKPPT